MKLSLELRRVTNRLVEEINEKISYYNESFDKGEIINYFSRDSYHESLMDDWLTNVLAEVIYDHKKFPKGVSRIVFTLAELAQLIKKISGCNWMTFMIQDPYASDNVSSLNFLDYNFGLSQKMQGSWRSSIDKPKEERVTTLTDVLFGKDVIGNDILCFRFGEFNMRPNDKENIFYVDYSRGSDGVTNTSFHSSYSEKHEKMSRHLKDEITAMDASMKFQQYVEFMACHAGFTDSPFLIYAIPVITVFLYPASKSRSGIFLVHDREIDPESLFVVQDTITKVLCHVDYLRAAIIQRQSDFELITHDLKGSVGYIQRNIKSLNIPENISRHFAFIDMLIKAFQREIKIDIQKINDLFDDDWLKNISDFARSSEERWSLYPAHVQLPLTKSETYSKYGFNTGHDLAGIIILLIFVLLRNAWKHQYFYCKKTGVSYAAINNMGIQVEIIDVNGNRQWMMILKNNSIKDSINEIEERKEKGQGTFAILAFLCSKINDFLNNDDRIKIEYRFNRVKEEFFQKLYLPKGIIYGKSLAD